MPHRIKPRMASKTARRSVAVVLVTAAGSVLPMATQDAALADPGTSAAPAAAKSPHKVIQDMVRRAFEILRDEGLKSQPKERVGKLREITDAVMDWDAMARGSLGFHWRDLSEKQRADFVSVFKELLARQYRDDVDRFRGTESVKFGEDEKKDSLVIVKTELTTASGEKVPIHYTLHQVGDKWLVEDFSVEGVSLTNHYRKTFNRFLVNKSFDALLQQLQSKLGT